MPVIKELDALKDEMASWRQNIHAHPETAFEEHRTSDLVAEKLSAFGIEIDRGMATTGVVGTLVNGDGPSIGLRADMDALDMPEQTDLPYKSRVPGKMHACGHDGHTTMLLGAAKHLAESKNFNGTVHFIFQPAEEMAGGGRVMVEEGLFDKFPADTVYGMHNWPNMPAGKISIGEGPGMASAAKFEIVVKGRGSHAAAPHQGIDPVVIGAEIVSGLQTISSRATNPIDAIVVSVTQFHAGDAMNVIPDQAVLGGTVRSFALDPEKTIKPQIEQIAGGIASAHGGSADVSYEQLYPVLVNNAPESEIARLVAVDVVGEENLEQAYPPTMASEDFAFMLNERPGTFVRLGAGFPDRETYPLHNTRYEFNDEILPIGASFWVRLVEKVLG